jgi:tetratricopeptide (TPR) repeat protein
MRREEEPAMEPKQTTACAEAASSSKQQRTIVAIMKASLKRFRKRQSTMATDLAPQSSELRQCRNLIQRGLHADALRQIEARVDAPEYSERRADLLCLVADSLHHQGKFEEAAQAYARAAKHAPTRSRAEARAMFGQISALIKSVKLPDAAALALSCIHHAAEAEAAHAKLTDLADRALKPGQPFPVPPAPPRASVLASRLGKLFFDEGEISHARQLFEAALKINPKGASRARLGMAEICLREGRAAEAEQWARQAIQVGGFRAKTLGAWPVLVAACRQCGTDPLEPGFLKGMAQAKPSVRFRARYLLVRHLREAHDPRWLPEAVALLDQPQGKPAALLAELRKLVLATAERLQRPPPVRLSAAEDLLATPQLSPNEWLSAAKQVILAQAALDQTVDVYGLVRQAEHYFQGQPVHHGLFRASLIHGLGLACQAAGRVETAKTLFMQNVAEQPAGSDAWGKSLWACARLLKRLGKGDEAALLFWTCYQQPEIPERFRLLSLIEWTRSVLDGRNPHKLGAIQAQLEAVLPQLTDYELVLDLARQVNHSGLRRLFGLRIFERGHALAWQALESATHPTAATAILYKLCQRANDFNQRDSIIATWEKLAPEKRQWLWSTHSDFWGWIELVCRAYRGKGDFAAAEAFALPLLNDPATPPHGYALLGVTYASMKNIRQGDFPAAFAVYERMVQVAPANEWTCHAYYWVGLREWNHGNKEATIRNGEKILETLGSDLGMAWKLRMAARGHLLRVGLNAEVLPPAKAVPSEELTAQWKQVQADLERLVL